MFNWHKKESPILSMLGIGGGIGSNLIGGGGSSVSVTGGTAIPDGSHTIRVFTSPGTLSISGGTLDVEYLVVGGGGAGGAGGGPGGGGGGAGGMLSGSGYTLPETDHSITVGDGGTWASPNTAPNASGNPSQLGSLIQAWGGGHGGQHNINSTGANGGSGGGGRSGDNSFSGTGPGGTGNRQTNTGTSVPSQGNPGGNSDPNGGCTYCGSGAGGGGAGGAGSNAQDSRGGGDGGIGAPVTWIPTDYGTTGPQPGRYFAGGGGGASRGDSGNNWPNPGGASGGSGGGGNGNGQSTYATAGGTNTGGGGGNGKNGGPGIVAIRYLS
mgnify:CR=1 FL=1